MPVDVGLLGKVDEVPGRYFVATQFLHLVGFPLIPLGSYVVVDNPKQLERQSRLINTATGLAFGLQSDPYESCKQVRIPLNRRSVLVGYIRPLLVTGYVASSVLFIGLVCELLFNGNQNGKGPQSWTFALLLALALGIVIGRRLAYRWATPTDERVAEIDRLLGLDPSVFRDR